MTNHTISENQLAFDTTLAVNVVAPVYGKRNKKNYKYKRLQDCIY